MARPLSYPLNELTPENRVMLIAGGKDLPGKVTNYANRHGFNVSIDRFGPSDDGRTLYRVQRYEVASGG